jgi:tetratricopeptide (TPR) repeat protein
MNDNSVTNLSNEAYASLTGGRLNDAKSLYTKLCELDSKNEENWLMLAAVNGEIGLIEEAKASVRKAIELDDTYVEAYLTHAHLLKKTGDNEGAITNALKAVEIDDEYDEAWTFLCGLAGQMGRYDDAEAWGKKAASIFPGNIEILLNLANAQYQQNKYHDAEETYKKILVAQPEDFPAKIGIAKLLTVQNRYNEAIVILEQITASSPNNSEALDYLGICYTGIGRIEEAKSIFNSIIENDKDYEYVYIHFANLMEKQGDIGNAISVLHKGKEQASEPLPFLERMARIYQEYGMQEKALECYEEAVNIDPDNYEARFSKILVLSDLARYEKALDELKQLETDYPVSSEIMGTKAGLLERIGQHDEAHELVKMCLNDESVPSGVINVYAHLCHRYNECEKVIDMMDNILDDDNLETSKRRGLLFTLGKLQDRIGNYDQAFARITEANLLKPFKYDHESSRNFVNQLMGPKITNILNDPPLVDVHHTVRPIFIVGMPRSGTSLVEQIIASHPDAFGGGERNEISDLVEKLPYMTGVTGSYPQCLTTLTSDVINKISKAYEMFTDMLPEGTKVLTDKMPENYYHIVFIRMLFPDSRIIHCVRNPLDTCLSIYFQQFIGYHDYAYDLESLGQHYNEYKRLMDHYRDDSKIPMMEVNYEDLVDDSETLSRSIIDYCGLGWDDRCLRFYDSERVVRTASYSQVSEPIYTRSVNRWKNYEKYLEPLKKALA